MALTFVGGSRDSTEVPESLVDAFAKPGDGMLYKMERGKARELYVLQDDGQVHYVKTVAPQKWRRPGDPCPVCEDRETTFQSMKSQPDEIIYNIGGEQYRLDGKRFALVFCKRCDAVVTADLDEK